jgi:hypothetical protein
MAAPVGGFPTARVILDSAERAVQGACRDGLTLPGAKRLGHPGDECHPVMGKPPARQQGLGRHGRRRAPAGVLGIPALLVALPMALPTPESRDAEIGIGPLQEAAQWSRIIAPGRVVPVTIIGQDKCYLVEQCAQLDVLDLMGERLRTGDRVRRQGHRHRAEAFSR